MFTGMVPKSDKENKNTGRKPAASKKSSEKPSPKSKPMDDDEDDDFDDDEETNVKSSSVKASKGASKKKAEDDDDDDDDTGVDEVDEWEKPEEEDTWDPDFEEFDIPKSKGKKATGTGGAGKKAGADDDLGLDEEFKEFDLFNDSGFDDDDDDF